jgi:LPXTG-site transpeptidase (sortase) family protein
MSRVAAGFSALLFIVAALLLGGVLPRGDVIAVPPSPSAAVVPATTSPQATPPFPPIPEGYRVQIPRLGIDLPILEGDIERDAVQLQTPENFAFHLPGTGIPGSGTNSYLYAHARRGMFLSLWNARVGDEVLISTPDGRVMRYVVAEVHPRVAPDDVQWAAATPPERLTLQTSTGPNPGDPRFVVIAQPG